MGPVAIHVVDDEPSVRVALERLLSASGFGVRTFESAEDFLASAGGEKGCLVLDIELPGMSGIELQDELIERGNGWEIVFLSAQRDIIVRSRSALIEKGAVAVLEKPTRAMDLLDAIHRALKRLGITHSPRADQPPPV